MTDPIDCRAPEGDPLPLPDQALIVRPGDTLILGFDRTVTAQEADQIKTKLRRRIPGVEVVIIAGGIKQIAAYRPDNESEG